MGERIGGGAKREERNGKSELKKIVSGSIRPLSDARNGDLG